MTVPGWNKFTPNKRKNFYGIFNALTMYGISEPDVMDIYSKELTKTDGIVKWETFLAWCQENWERLSPPPLDEEY